MPKKYRLLCKIPHTDYEVGKEFELNRCSEIVYDLSNGFAGTIEPHEILLMVKAGILEEVKEEEILNFKECFECAKEPGMPQLCKQCLIVRQDFEKLMERKIR